MAIVSTSFVQGSDTVTLTLGAQPADGTHKVTVEDGADYAGFKVEKVTKEFVFGKDETAPVATVKSASPKKIVLTFNEDVTNVIGNDNVQFYHTYKGVDAYKATKSLDGRELTLEFTNPLPEGAFKLYLAYTDDKGTKIQDLWGNKLEETTFTGSVVVDNVAPTVTKVEADGNTGIKVTYSEEVSGADNLSNYTLKDAAGKTITLSGTVTKSGNTYTVPTPALNGGSYTLTIKNVKDTSIAENKMADYTTTVSVKDIVPPTVADLDDQTDGTQAQLLSSKKVKIVFSEVMDKDSIENPLNYLFVDTTDKALDSKVKLTAVDGNKAVVLDFTDVATGAQSTPASSTIKVLRVKDVAGNPTATASTTVLVPSTATAPLFDKAEVVGKNAIKVYFKELITGAKATDFLVSNDSGSQYGTATQISNEVVDGKSVITLTSSVDLPTSAVGIRVKSNDTEGYTVSATNSFGTKVALTAKTPDDKYAPLATAAQALDTDANGHVDAFVVSYSEGLYVPSVSDSDFTIEGYEIKSVSVVGNTVTLNVKEKDSSDLTVTPKVTQVGSVEDLARNARASQDALVAKSVSTQAAEALAAAVKAVNDADRDGLEDALGNPVLGLELTAYKKLNSAQRLTFADAFIAAKPVAGYATKTAIQTELNKDVVSVAVNAIIDAAKSGDWSGAKVSTFTTAAGITGVTDDNYNAVKAALQSAKNSLTDKASIQAVVDSVVTPG